MTNHNNGDLTRFKWIIIAALIALVLILGTVQELAK